MNQSVEEQGENGEKLKDELSICQHFLVNTEMENGKHTVFNLQMSKLDTKITNEKIEEVFNKLDSAVKIIIALWFVLRNIETGKYRYFYAHENNILFEGSHLLCMKAYLITIKGKVEKFVIGEQCTQERQKTKWRLKLITDLKVFAALLKTSQCDARNLSFLKSYYDIRKRTVFFLNKDNNSYKDHL